MNKRRFAGALLAAVLFLTFLLSGCGSAQTAENMVTIAYANTIVSLDSTKVQDSVSLGVLSSCMEGLLQFDSDGNIVPAAAESYEISEDGLTYTFHLRDCKWSDGSPVTANDFVFAWKKMASEHEPYASLLSDNACVKNADAVINGVDGVYADADTLGIYADDDRTFRVELECPVSYFLKLTCFPALYPIKQSFYESLEEGYYGTSPETFLSNGAFMLADYIPGSTSVLFKKNENYWDADNVKLDYYRVLVVSSEDTVMDAFRVGTIDFASISGTHIEAAQKDSSLQNCLTTKSTATLYYVCMNEQNEYLANWNLRMALTCAVDRATINSEVYKESGNEIYRIIASDFTYSDMGEDFGEDPDLYKDEIGYDVEKARDYLEKAKQELGTDHFEFTLIYSNENTNDINTVQMLKAQIEENLPDVTINLAGCSKSERIAKQKQSDYELAYSSWGPDYVDPTAMLLLFQKGSSFNYCAWENEEFESLNYEISRGDLALDPEKRWEAMKRMEELAVEGAAVIPIGNSVRVYLISDRCKGLWTNSNQFVVVKDIDPDQT